MISENSVVLPAPFSPSSAVKRDCGTVRLTSWSAWRDPYAWLTSRTAHVVRFFTLGFVNPRRLVNTEVQKALVDATRQLNTNLWWMTVQMGLRIAFGLSLWLTWAVSLQDLSRN